MLTVAAAGVPSGADTVFSFVLTNPTHNQLAPPQPLISATASIGFDVEPMRMPQGDVLVSDDRERPPHCASFRRVRSLRPRHPCLLPFCVVAVRSGDERGAVDDIRGPDRHHSLPVRRSSPLSSFLLDCGSPTHVLA